jgi:hypothetical protein
MESFRTRLFSQLLRFTNIAHRIIKDREFQNFNYSTVYLTGGSNNWLVTDNYVHDCTRGAGMSAGGLSPMVATSARVTAAGHR